jgi:transposase
MEFALAKRELAQVKMERDFLKKASAYFAREPQSGTCLRADTHRQARS